MAVLFDTRACHRTLTDAVVLLRKDMGPLGRGLKIWTGGVAAAVAGLIIGVITLS